MKLEQQVVSLELAKKLKELGVEQKSFFFHWTDGIEWYINRELSISIENIPEKVMPEMWSAYTVAELGEMLLPECDSGKTIDGTVAANNGRWVCGLLDPDGTRITNKFYADTEADARAKMLIYLLENKLITL